MSFYNLFQQDISEIYLSGHRERELIAHKSLGKLNFSQDAIGHGIDLMQMSSQVNQPIRIHADGKEQGGSLISVVVFLRGFTNIHMPELGQDFALKQGAVHFIYSPIHEGHMEFLPDPAEAVIVRMTLERFLQTIANDHRSETLTCFSSLIKNKDEPLHRSCHLTPHIQSLLQDIIAPSCPFASNLLRDARAHEFFFEVIEEIIRSRGKDTRIFSNRDKQKLLNAKQLLVDRLDSPPSIMELAREVGLNDFKLKKGFRSLFDSTVYGVVLDARLEKARSLLSNADLNITQVSQHVGYANHGHFSAAFKKRFGMTPRDFARHHGTK